MKQRAARRMLPIDDDDTRKSHSCKWGKSEEYLYTRSRGA